MSRFEVRQQGNSYIVYDTTGTGTGTGGPQRAAGPFPDKARAEAAAADLNRTWPNKSLHLIGKTVTGGKLYRLNKVTTFGSRAAKVGARVSVRIEPGEYETGTITSDRGYGNFSVKLDSGETITISSKDVWQVIG